MTAVCPGPVRTEFFEVARTEEDGQNAKDNFMKEPEVVVRQAYLMRQEVKNCLFAAFQ